MLAALTWLGGTHLNPREPAPYPDLEDVREARLAEEVRSRADVRATLDALARSENAWVRGAAQQALEAEGDFPAGP